MLNLSHCCKQLSLVTAISAALLSSPAQAACTLFTDGFEQNSTATGDCAVNHPPQLTGDKKASVSQGGNIIIGKTNLGYKDVDKNDEVTFYVNNLKHGEVLFSGMKVDSFSPTQLDGGNISFKHNGSVDKTASFDVWVEDGDEDKSTPKKSTFTINVEKIVLPTPSAPTNPQHNDDNDTFKWDFVAGYPNPSDYEYSINGSDWTVATSNPIKVGDKDIAKGLVRVRVKASAKNNAGKMLASTEEYSKKITDIGKTDWVPYNGKHYKVLNRRVVQGEALKTCANESTAKETVKLANLNERPFTVDNVLASNTLGLNRSLRYLVNEGGFGVVRILQASGASWAMKQNLHDTSKLFPVCEKSKNTSTGTGGDTSSMTWVTVGNKQFAVINEKFNDTIVKSKCTLARSSDVDNTVIKKLGLDKASEYAVDNGGKPNILYYNNGASGLASGWRPVNWTAGKKAYPICTQKASQTGGGSGGSGASTPSTNWESYNGKQYKVLSTKKDGTDVKNACTEGNLVDGSILVNNSAITDKLKLTKTVEYGVQTHKIPRVLYFSGEWKIKSWSPMDKQLSPVCEKADGSGSTGGSTSGGSTSGGSTSGGSTSGGSTTEVTSWKTYGDKKYKVLTQKVSSSNAQSTCRADDANANLANLDDSPIEINHELANFMGLQSSKQYFVNHGVAYILASIGKGKWNASYASDKTLLLQPVCMKPANAVDTSTTAGSSIGVTDWVSIGANRYKVDSKKVSKSGASSACKIASSKYVGEFTDKLKLNKSMKYVVRTPGYELYYYATGPWVIEGWKVSSWSDKDVKAYPICKQ